MSTMSVYPTARGWTPPTTSWSLPAGGGSSSINTLKQWLHLVVISLVLSSPCPTRGSPWNWRGSWWWQVGWKRRSGAAWNCLSPWAPSTSWSVTTSSLHHAYQHLLEEQTKLVEVDMELGERLMLFQSVSRHDDTQAHLPHGVRAEGTFLRLLSTINQYGLPACTYLWQESLLPSPTWLCSEPTWPGPWRW